MSVIKCKMCGGELALEEGSTICECEYCGSKQTVPVADDDRKMKLYERANKLRFGCEFDKAAGVYENIISDFSDEAEAYWGMLLCKYGIEYVDDPFSGKKVPTCHRSSFESIMDDSDFEMVMENADSISRGLYREQAKEIEEIRKGIIEVSGKEQPYDIFICYKETAEDGQRTLDSVIAQDVYEALTSKGYRVFFSRISLEDKLGTEYEPYIFAALNSAKIMLAFGTCYDYYNAVWVKNEWSRFLKLMAKDKEKHLIPCYKGIDAYDIPKEFAKLQAQDMGKVGAMQDLLRGIDKIIGKNDPGQEAKQTQTIIQQVSGGPNVAALLDRGNMALEDGNYSEADGYFDQVLNMDARCAEAYIGKMLAKSKERGLDSWVKAQKEKYTDIKPRRIDACPEDTAHINKIAAEMVLEGYLDEDTVKSLYEFDRGFDSALADIEAKKNLQFQMLGLDKLLNRAKQYASGENEKRLNDALAEITAVWEKRISDAKAQDEQSIARVKSAYAEHIKSADKKAEELNKDAQNRREQRYLDAKNAMENASSISAYEKAHSEFLYLKGYKDSEALVSECQKQIDRMNEEKRQEEERQAKEAERAAEKRKTIAVFVAAAAVVCIVAIIVIISNSNYKSALALMESGDYDGAIAGFEALGKYKDSAEQVMECKYLNAVSLMESGDYDSAIAAFKAMDGYKDSTDQIEAFYVGMYGEETYNLIKSINVGDSYIFGTYEQDHITSNGKEDIEWIVLETDGANILLISKYALDCKEYNSKNTYVTWETCSLRSWLNSTFINDAFSPEEITLISETTVTADKNPKYSTDPGNDTIDKVFLLSINEANTYFSSDEARKCVPTAYARANGAYTSDKNTSGGKATCLWWLRSPGFSLDGAASVYLDGSVDFGGHYVGDGTSGVRPALWINLAS